MATYLDRIVAAHRAAARQDERDLDALASQAARAGAGRGFGAALSRGARERGGSGWGAGTGGGSDGGGTGMAVIAEVKRRSPSKGPLAPDLDPASLARSYSAGGASAVSVLTDTEFFGGSAADLRAARAAVDLPVLRKDFTVAPADVFDARIMGADAVLLIVAALTPSELRTFLELSASVGLDALVEVHDEAEAELAIESGAAVIGVNQRDLLTFEVDTERAVRVASVLPEGVVRVAESGITGGDDVRRLRDAGFDAVLVGETLVRSGDPERAVSSLRALAPAAS